MKYLFALILGLVVSFNGFSQQITKSLENTRFGGFGVSYYYVVSQNSDTLYKIRCAFQNAQYQHITDIGYINILNQNALQEFAANVEKVLPHIGSKDGSASFAGSDYTLKAGRSNLLFIHTSEGQFTTITKNQATKLAAWLRLIEAKNTLKAI